MDETITLTRTDLIRSSWPLPGLSGGTLSDYIVCAEKVGGKKAAEVAGILKAAALESNAGPRFDFLKSAFMTKSEEPKALSAFITAKMETADPTLPAAITTAQNHILSVIDRLKTLRMFRATLSALTLAERLEQDYEDLKRQRCYLDFEDLIIRTADLLTRSDAGAWVHYKLDQGIDHILVDEAQDTSPEQWRIIRALSDDFFSGRTSREIRRTLFAVGDEKQSIYSFQGARPERFSEERTDLARRISGGQAFSAVSLPLSFRSTDAVLSAVDRVFSVPENARGLSATNEPVVHLSSRIGHPGIVEFWDVIAAEAPVREEDWTAPFDSTPESAPPAVLARRIAHKIRDLIRTGTIIEKGERRSVEAGDILVLVRKRDAFVNALNRALKREPSVPVAGADRLRLTSHIAVQDLMALGRHLILPEDDLSLAAALKSPIFDLDEDDVFQIAALRPDGMTVGDHLKLLAEADSRLEVVETRLGLLRKLACSQSVHDFYARLLGQYGGRRQFLARLGHEVSDILDEFLSFALDHEQHGLPGLAAFLATLETESPEVKREQDKGRGEVRIMTVHAAKGLEAPIVFLVDGGSKAFNSQHLPKLRMLDSAGSTSPVPVWIPGKSLENNLTRADAAKLRTAAEEEYRRLLYVGMTRAADHLVICGYRGSRQVPDTWASLVRAALVTGDNPAEAQTFAGPEGEWEGLCWKPMPVPVELIHATRHEKTEEEHAFPEALIRPLPPEPFLPRPLSPSEAGVVVVEEDGDRELASPLFGERSRSGRAAERGRLTHRMMQVLPGLPEAERVAAAERYLDRTARYWPKAERQSLHHAICRLLEDPELEAVFAAGSRAEVAVMGMLRLRGRDYAISGRIDRMAVLDERVILVDFKTNRQPPSMAEEAPLAHRAQLAIYRDIIQPLYPGKRVECLLIYTETAGKILLPDALLDRSLAEITAK